MDLIGDYGSDDSSSSSSSSDDEGDVDDDEQTRKQIDEKENPTNNKKNKKKKKDVVVDVDVVEIVLSQNIIPEDTFVRSVPHIPGNWAGHIYVDVIPTNDETTTATIWREAMEDSIQRFQQYLAQQQQQQQQKQPPGSSTTGCGSSRIQLVSHLDSDIHMSLSRPFALQISSLESFVAKLRSRLRHLPTTTLRVNNTPFQERILVNDEKTRSFWTWTIPPNPTVLAIVDEINSVLRIYNQLPFYDPPIFHISLASVVGEIVAQKAITTTTTTTTKPATKGNPLTLPVRKIHCTFGTTKHYTIDLLDM